MSEKDYKRKAEQMFQKNTVLINELEQAKEIIGELLKTQPPIENVYDIGKFDIDDYKDAIAKAEAFLNEGIEFKTEMFPKITLPKGSAEFVDKVIADAEKRLKE